MGRRSEVINDALAEEIQRSEQRKKRRDKTTAAIPEPEPAAPAGRDLRGSPLEPDPNPQRSLLVKSPTVDSKVRRGQLRIQTNWEPVGNGHW